MREGSVGPPYRAWVNPPNVAQMDLASRGRGHSGTNLIEPDRSPGQALAPALSLNARAPPLHSCACPHVGNGYATHRPVSSGIFGVKGMPCAVKNALLDPAFCLSPVLADVQCASG